MDHMEYENAERSAVAAMYDMTPEQKQNFLYTVRSKANTDLAQAAIVGDHDLKSLIQDTLKTEPTEPILTLVRRSAVWKGLEASMQEFGKKRLAEALAVLKS